MSEAEQLCTDLQKDRSDLCDFTPCAVTSESSCFGLPAWTEYQSLPRNLPNPQHQIERAEAPSSKCVPDPSVNTRCQIISHELLHLRWDANAITTYKRSLENRAIKQRTVVFDKQLSSISSSMPSSVPPKSSDYKVPLLTLCWIPQTRSALPFPRSLWCEDSSSCSPPRAPTKSFPGFIECASLTDRAGLAVDRAITWVSYGDKGVSAMNLAVDKGERQYSMTEEENNITHSSLMLACDSAHAEDRLARALVPVSKAQMTSFVRQIEDAINMAHKSPVPVKLTHPGKSLNAVCFIHWKI
ncbi:hypothetical protein STEG23_016634 [Scotinomys teguina]